MNDPYTNPIEYLANLIRWLDIGVNTILAGNDRQTLSSRLYEAAVLEHIWYWHPLYWLVNAGYLLLGQANHCKDAFLAFPELRTYS